MAINEASKKLITTELLASMKPSAMFVSVVHDLFDEQIVLDMVKNGNLFGFGFEAAPGSFNKYEGNVWAAPAYAWTTDGSMNNSMVKWVENMVNATQDNFPNRVN
jgi:lactate dehydrogenase-like 2-hydroxyacid dehydrogenase